MVDESSAGAGGGKGLAGAGISGGMAGTGAGGESGSGPDALAQGDNLGGGGTVGGAAVSLANDAGASTADRAEGGGLDRRATNQGDLAGGLDHPQADPSAGGPAPDPSGVMPGAVARGKTGSGLAGGTAPGGPLDLGPGPAPDQ